ncbi:MAG: SDR family NAD(P)-dependent oxidoreductase [Saprospiraceae bacterium]|nr:SDR family NAD(P)-dependent oxidoreductase [Saprospiraceae bacterium]
MRHIVITGTSSGIGYATVKYLIDRGFYVFGCVRTEKDAAELRKAYPQQFSPLVFDLVDEEGIRNSVEEVGKHLDGQPLFGLVNNAASVVSGPIAHVSKEDMFYQFEVNTFGPLNLCQAYFPLIRGKEGQQPGRIVNVTSLSGEIAMPFLGPYSASKRALMSMNHTLRREFYPYGVDVIEVVPGRVKTGIIEKLNKVESQYAGTDFEEPMQRRMETAMEMREFGLEPEVISGAIYTALTARKPKYRYVKPDLYFKGYRLPTMLPARMIDRILGKQMRLLPSFLRSK